MLRLAWVYVLFKDAKPRPGSLGVQCYNIGDKSVVAIGATRYSGRRKSSGGLFHPGFFLPEAGVNFFIDSDVNYESKAQHVCPDVI